jgi:hypothetical protein
MHTGPAGEEAAMKRGIMLRGTGLLLWTGMISIISTLALQCGGDKGTATRSKHYIRFENQYNWAPELNVIIEACHQRFTIERGETETIECVPKDGSTSFLVIVEMTPEEGWAHLRQECMVEGGQTVTIRRVAHSFSLFVDGEQCSPDEVWHSFLHLIFLPRPTIVRT